MGGLVSYGQCLGWLGYLDDMGNKWRKVLLISPGRRGLLSSILFFFLFGRFPVIFFFEIDFPPTALSTDPFTSWEVCFGRIGFVRLHSAPSIIGSLVVLRARVSSSAWIRYKIAYCDKFRSRAGGANNGLPSVRRESATTLHPVRRLIPS